MEQMIYKSATEFYNAVADDCIKNLSEKDKVYIRDYPSSIMYHFSYCLFIRNHYIYGKDIMEADFFVEPDEMSSEIMKVIISKLLPEYIYGDRIIEYLYDEKDFIIARKKYKDKFGEYPTDIILEYVSNVDLEPIPDWISDCEDFEYARKIERDIWDRNWNKLKNMEEELVYKINQLIAE